jgi:protoporphyrinogen oxidase
MSYDLLIIGGGITGLYMGLEWLKRNPHTSCCIVERYEELGGRVVTYYPPVKGKGKLHWEAGAGRISTRHTRVLRLLKEYGLTFYPIQGQWGFNHPSAPNPFSSLSDVYFSAIECLSPSILANHTLSELLTKIYGKPSKNYMASFPYYSEFHTLRADLAIHALRGELKSGEGFGVCSEGLTTLIHHMAADFKRKGGKVITNTAVIDIDYQSEPIIVSAKTDKKNIEYHANRVVCAIQAPAFSSIKSLSSLPFLRHLKMEPLLRIYAVFPTHQGRSWFSDLSTTVFDHRIRFFIPVRADKGVAMISYTEGKDADHWSTMTPSKQKSEVLRALREVFPFHTIPDPLYYHDHLWKEGCTYWLPGNYSPKEESDKSLQPFLNYPLYLCNESFAINQSWMESGLIQVDKVLKIIV